MLEQAAPPVMLIFVMAVLVKFEKTLITFARIR
jgi:hypothetical protein